jgi:drug/metabolite transporter (DMT)-like permease
VTPPAGSPRERTLAYLAWVTICIVWGTTYLAIRVALDTVPVALLGGLRWTAAGAILIAVLVARGEPLPPLRHWGAIGLAGFLMVVVSNGGVVWAEQYVPSGLTAVILAVLPFWTVLVDALLPRGERLSGRGLTGLSIGFAGIVVLVWSDITLGGQEGSSFLSGVVVLQLACLGWAVGTAYTRGGAAFASPFGASAVQMLLSGLMMTAIGTAMGEWSRLAFSARSAGALIYLTLFGSIVGYSAYVYAIKHLPLSLVSLYAYINPLIAVVLGALLLGEPFSIRTVVAAALVFAGVAVVRTSAGWGTHAPARRTAAGVPSAGRR